MKANDWSPEIVSQSDLVIRMGRPTVHLDVGQLRIGAEEIKRIANPKIDIFSKDRPLLTDVMSGKMKGRTDKNQVTFFANSRTQGLQFASTAGYVGREAKKQAWARKLRPAGSGKILATESNHEPFDRPEKVTASQCFSGLSLVRASQRAKEPTSNSELSRKTPRALRVRATRAR